MTFEQDNNREKNDETAKSEGIGIQERLNTKRPTSDLSLNLLNNEDRLYEDLEYNDKELSEWIHKNHWFFSKKFFPAAQHYETVTQLINRSL